MAAGRGMVGTRGAACGLALSPLHGRIKKRTQSPPHCAGDCPMCAAVSTSTMWLGQDRRACVPYCDRTITQDDFLYSSNNSLPPLMVTMTPFGYMAPRSKGMSLLQRYIEFLH